MEQLKVNDQKAAEIILSVQNCAKEKQKPWLTKMIKK